jgi:hypothetical protein
MLALPLSVRQQLESLGFRPLMASMVSAAPVADVSGPQPPAAVQWVAQAAALSASPGTQSSPLADSAAVSRQAAAPLSTSQLGLGPSSLSPPVFGQQQQQPSQQQQQQQQQRGLLPSHPNSQVQHQPPPWLFMFLSQLAPTPLIAPQHMLSVATLAPIAPPASRAFLEIGAAALQAEAANPPFPAPYKRNRSTSAGAARQKKHKCNLCGYAFAGKTDLMRHMLVHSG